MAERQPVGEPNFIALRSILQAAEGTTPKGEDLTVATRCGDYEARLRHGRIELSPAYLAALLDFVPRIMMYPLRQGQRR